MNIDLYIIEALTNIHVGSGDINFDIIDNQVQKDAITGYPVIHSSSFKGALREHFRDKNIDSNLITYIFGNDNTQKDAIQAGAFSFFEAKLLTRPVRSNKKPYFNATSYEILSNLVEMLNSLNINRELAKELESFLKGIKNSKFPVIFEKSKGVILEDEIANYSKTTIPKRVKELLGEDLAIFSHESFKSLDLPVIARNRLENGESENLWYEEFVPSKSKFYLFIAKPDNLDETIKDSVKSFEKELSENIVQIGANSSIGYGYSKVTKFGE